jgi:hypothetical protein
MSANLTSKRARPARETIRVTSLRQETNRCPSSTFLQRVDSEHNTQNTTTLSGIKLKFKMSTEITSADPSSSHVSISEEWEETWFGEWPTEKSRKPKSVELVSLLKKDSGNNLTVSKPSKKSQTREDSATGIRLRFVMKQYDEDSVAIGITTTEEATPDSSQPSTPAEVRWAMRKASVKKPYLPYLMAGEEDEPDASRVKDMAFFIKYAKRTCMRLYEHQNVLETGSALLDDDADPMWEKAPILKTPPWTSKP